MCSCCQRLSPRLTSTRLVPRLMTAPPKHCAMYKQLSTCLTWHHPCCLCCCCCYPATGYPVRVHKTRAVVRLMFFNPDDVRWFKPLELWTKSGRRGRITEPLGTHGAFKARFDGPISQVCWVFLKGVQAVKEGACSGCVGGARWRGCRWLSWVGGCWWVRWFKPLELWTECCRGGRIYGTTGFHGAFNARFDGPLSQVGGLVCVEKLQLEVLWREVGVA